MFDSHVSKLCAVPASHMILAAFSRLCTGLADLGSCPADEWQSCQLGLSMEAPAPAAAARHVKSKKQKQNRRYLSYFIYSNKVPVGEPLSAVQ